ncbi:MAG TPA: sigma-70 family RNA polymerase sigma factor, partial [Candidatus Acidoferrum sp.]|nr:sigma-70 family RNA polymerase sigma factor [Candidatus Acidoferrum sp.]
MSDTPPSMSDRECLVAWKRGRGVESLLPLLQRYAAFVYSSAYRRTGGNDTQAAEITRAVFLVLARRARKLPRKTVVAGWLFHITALTCRKVQRRQSRLWPWRWLKRSMRPPFPDDAPLWTRVAPEFDRALDKLPPKQRDSILLRIVLALEPLAAAQILRTRERRAEKRVKRGLNKIAKRLRKHAGLVDAKALALACAAEACRAPMPLSLSEEIAASIRETLGKRPRLKLARRVLNSLAFARWRRRIAIGVPCALLLLAGIIAIAWFIDARTGHSRLLARFIEWSVRREAKTVPGLAAPAKSWPTDPAAPRLDAARVRTEEDIYRATNIWLAHLKFSAKAWDAMQPKRIATLPHFLRSDGSALLRNPKAQRSGLAGVLGFDFDWTTAELEFGGMPFTNVAARIK